MEKLIDRSVYMQTNLSSYNPNSISAGLLSKTVEFKQNLINCQPLK